jgi:hypothetical protein
VSLREPTPGAGRVNPAFPGRVSRLHTPTEYERSPAQEGDEVAQQLGRQRAIGGNVLRCAHAFADYRRNGLALERRPRSRIVERSLQRVGERRSILAPYLLREAPPFRLVAPIEAAALVPGRAGLAAGIAPAPRQPCLRAIARVSYQTSP